MWVVYLLNCNDNSLYTGITNNLDKRVNTHNSGKGSKYVRSRLPAKLFCYKEMENKSEAAKLEYKIKKLSRQNKFTYTKCWLRPA